MDDPALAIVDIDAVGEAVDALEDAGIQVESVDEIARDGEDGRVRWTMTMEADTRTTDLGEFDDR